MASAKASTVHPLDVPTARALREASHCVARCTCNECFELVFGRVCTQKCVCSANLAQGHRHGGFLLSPSVSCRSQILSASDVCFLLISLRLSAVGRTLCASDDVCQL
jgi:hypothetical protein